METALTFNDVLLEPRYSDIESRSKVDTTVWLTKATVNKPFFTKLKHPLVPANMKSVIGLDMARAIFLSGGLGLVHRFMSIEDQIAIPMTLEGEFDKAVWDHIGLSVGVKEADKKAVDLFAVKGCKIVCVDVAHGHSKNCIDMCHYIREKYPDMFLIAGNVATYIGTRALLGAGVDAVKVGVGNGSTCLTRIETGNGVPSLYAIQECVRAKEEFGRDMRYIIADGGMSSAGDCCKALAAGADLLMLGNMFARTVEANGEVKIINGQKYKSYAGSSTLKSEHIEGVEAVVPANGTVKEMIDKVMAGIRSCCSYQGCRVMTDLPNVAKFVRITNAGMVESGAHDVMVVK